MNKFLKQGVYRFKNVTVTRRDGDILIDIPNEGPFYVSSVEVPQKFRVGDLCSYKEEGTNKVHIGFSFCHDIDLKWYRKDVGFELALNVADKSFDENINVPKSFEEDVAFYAKRCKKYYKDAVLPEWATKLMDKYCY